VTTPTDTAAPKTMSAQLCAFSRCRAPLPPPGPRGGRPFEFCPDRTWPGGKSCKQLAGAEDALRDALGDSTDAIALAGTTADFVARADQVLGPVAALAGALNEVKERVGVELESAVALTQQARAEAAEDRGLREKAQQLTAEAGKAREEADALADTCKRHRDEALTYRDKAIADARDAELRLAQAEVVARAERERADAAEQRALADRAAAEKVGEDATKAREHAATTNAELAAVRAALSDAREDVVRTEKRCAADVDAARTASTLAADRFAAEITQIRKDAHADRARLAETQERLRQLDETHRDRLGELRENLGAAGQKIEQLSATLVERDDLLRAVRAHLAQAPALAKQDPAEEPRADELKVRLESLLNGMRPHTAENG